MSGTISQDTLDELTNALDVGDDFDFHADYSGRGMYGAECVAIYTDASMWAVLAGLVQLSRWEEEGTDLYAALEILIDNEPRADSMGLGNVYYWPHITIEEV